MWTTLAGCRENPVSTYEVARTERPQRPPMVAAGSTNDLPPHRSADLEWTKPAGWSEGPGSQMRLASYAFTAPDGSIADVSVTSFPDAAGGLLANINRWRSQVGLAPVNAPVESGTPVEIAGQQAWLLDLSGTASGNAPAMGNAPALSGPVRLLGAIVPAGGTSWFFKMIGPVEVVTSQEAAFRELIASIRAVTAADPHAGLDMSAAGTPADPHAGLDLGSMTAGASLLPEQPKPAGFTFEAPDGWEPRPGSAMRVASFGIPGPGVPAADVSVFALGGPAGGELANVNRWRGQLGLAPVDPAQLEAAAVRIEGNEGMVLRLFEFESQAAVLDGAHRMRMMAAILPRGDTTWFFKLTGESAHVASQREKFIAFVRSFHFDHEH